MLATTPSEYPALLPLSQGYAASIETRRSLWRHDDCPAECQRPTIALSWMLALSLACLSIGGIGLSTPVKRPFKLLSMTSAPVGEENVELTMLEMSAPTAEASLDSTQDEATLDLLLPEPDVLPELAPQPLEDLPEVAEVLTAEDLFTVPAAAPVEDMLKPETPRRTEPAPAPTPRPRTSPTTTSASRTPATSGTATGATTGGSGGTGTSARGSSKGYFPAPPYPAAARTRGIQGTVYLSITFGTNGRVTAASVSRSSGYSDLDRAAGDWVRRNWRAPAGQTGTYRQPVQFRLR